jgi:hypothetical protein
MVHTLYSSLCCLERKELVEDVQRALDESLPIRTVFDKRLNCFSKGGTVVSGIFVPIKFVTVKSGNHHLYEGLK